MSNYDRQRERKRIVIIAGIVLGFFGLMLLFGHIATQSMAGADRETQENR